MNLNDLDEFPFQLADKDREKCVAVAKMEKKVDKPIGRICGAHGEGIGNEERREKEIDCRFYNSFPKKCIFAANNNFKQ